MRRRPFRARIRFPFSLARFAPAVRIARAGCGSRPGARVRFEQRKIRARRAAPALLRRERRALFRRKRLRAFFARNGAALRNERFSLATAQDDSERGCDLPGAGPNRHVNSLNPAAPFQRPQPRGNCRQPPNAGCFAQVGARRRHNDAPIRQVAECEPDRRRASARPHEPFQRPRPRAATPFPARFKSLSAMPGVSAHTVLGAGLRAMFGAGLSAMFGAGFEHQVRRGVVPEAKRAMRRWAPPRGRRNAAVIARRRPTTGTRRCTCRTS